MQIQAQLESHSPALHSQKQAAQLLGELVQVGDWVNIHKYLYNSNVSEMSNAFCARQSHCCEPVLVRMPGQNLMFLIIPLPPLYSNIPQMKALCPVTTLLLLLVPLFLLQPVHVSFCSPAHRLELSVPMIGNTFEQIKRTSGRTAPPQLRQRSSPQAAALQKGSLTHAEIIS